MSDEIVFDGAPRHEEFWQDSDRLVSIVPSGYMWSTPSAHHSLYMPQINASFPGHSGDLSYLLPEDGDPSAGFAQSRLISWPQPEPKRLKGYRYIPDRLRNQIDPDYFEPMEVSADEYDDGTKCERYSTHMPPSQMFLSDRTYTSHASNSDDLIKSLQHLVTWTDKQVRRFWLPPDLMESIDKLVSHGYNYVQAKRQIIAENLSELLDLNQSSHHSAVNRPKPRHSACKAVFKKSQRKKKQSENKKRGESIMPEHNIDITIVHRDHPQSPLTLNDLMQIRKEVMKEYSSSCMNARHLRFTKFKPGFVTITCHDQNIADWLRVTVSKLTNFHLKTLPPHEKPKLYKCSIYVPNAGTRSIIQEVLKLLRDANSRLNTLVWFVNNNFVQEGGIFSTLEIDELSLQALRDAKFEIQLPKYGTIKFTLLKY